MNTEKANTVVYRRTALPPFRSVRKPKIDGGGWIQGVTAGLFRRGFIPPDEIL